MGQAAQHLRARQDACCPRPWGCLPRTYVPHETVGGGQLLSAVMSSSACGRWRGRSASQPSAYARASGSSRDSASSRIRLPTARAPGILLRQVKPRTLERTSTSPVVSRSSDSVIVRIATAADVPALTGIREHDAEAGPADSRMAPYLRGRHHPHLALPQRAAYLAECRGGVAGYIAGHLTRRYNCEGEVQYLYVAPSWRRSGVGTVLLQRLAAWFLEHGAIRVCVNVNTESPGADPFYIRHGALHLQPYWRVWPDVRELLDRDEGAPNSDSRAAL